MHKSKFKMCVSNPNEPTWTYPNITLKPSVIIRNTTEVQIFFKKEKKERRKKRNRN